MQLKNAAGEARKEGKRDMRLSHIPLITAEYELLRKEIIADNKVLTKVRLLSSDPELQRFVSAPAGAGSAQDQDPPSAE